MKKLFLLAFVFVGFTATSYAQLSAIAQITANVQSPTSITKNVNLNFGNIYTPLNAYGAATGLNGGYAGEVTVAPKEGPVTRTTNGPILGVGQGTAAKFTINGDISSQVSITLPTSVPITLFNGIDYMNVSLDFSDLNKYAGNSSNATPSGGYVNTSGTASAGNSFYVSLDSGGSYVFYVGGTITLTGHQAWGSYSNVTDLEFIINQP